MLKTLSDLLRGAAADQAQALHDANAVVLLRQQIRDAAGALAVARRELAIAMAHQAGELRAVEALTGRAAGLEAAAAKALADRRDDLATEAAIRIAALEDEAADRRAALDAFEADVARLRRLVGDGEGRLRDLDRGLQTARATEAVRRAGANGRRGIAHASGALQDAEATLARLRDRQTAGADIDAALAALDGVPRDIEARLDAAGYGKPRTDPAAILERIRARAA
ncbi:PspA/IM30 family protein [Methylobacterium sp. NEAU 140]|uniref:PspA/IM30 family protein n=1 Tax=Methylobacterium sp. NEAU 140 TaxID=3064945 RepID=UPI002737322C|nr:PspA/IM30 family protein [Methylobacterium sp. NEAU 140]MDP4024668.1 PspA/IM30 family protein [Methylobacterium sp. NEAU 140]